MHGDLFKNFLNFNKSHNNNEEYIQKLFDKINNEKLLYNSKLYGFDFTNKNSTSDDNIYVTESKGKSIKRKLSDILKIKVDSTLEFSKLSKSLSTRNYTVYKNITPIQTIYNNKFYNTSIKFNNNMMIEGDKSK